ncbi:MAG TPA: DegV family protein [Chloroflexi bacterium]|nr:DegV family protein [Chloroflexota bacterium]
MSKVHIVTDSDSDIDPSLAEKLGVVVLPIRVHLDGGDENRHGGRRLGSQTLDKQVWEDGLDLNREDLLLQMSERRVHPRVVEPTASDFRRLYSRLTRHTDQIISLHSSASLSPICAEAERAAQSFLGRCDIAVMDSETISLGLQILVKEAARLANASVPLHDVLRHIRGLVSRIYVVMVTRTMDYLKYSHLISSTQAVLGTMLGISPFLSIEDGRIIPMEKVRYRERIVDKLIEFAAEFSLVDQVAILQSVSYPTEETKQLQERLQQLWPEQDLPILVYGPLLASHVGPDGIGLIVYEGQRPEGWVW